MTYVDADGLTTVTFNTAAVAPTGAPGRTTLTL